MSVQVITKEQQAYGEFNGGAIVENKPIGFPREGGLLHPYSNIFYWARALAVEDSTIGLHPHQGFEIMSFVLSGQIRHYDSKLKDWKPLQAGDVQIIRAGSGISHAEFLAKDAVIFQIWLDPDLNKTLHQDASYNDYKKSEFPQVKKAGLLITTYVGDNAPIKMDTEGLEIIRLEFDNPAYTEEIDPRKIYSIYVLDGTVKINGEEAIQHSFVVIREETTLQIEGSGSGKLFRISSPAHLNYKTYREVMQERMRVR